MESYCVTTPCQLSACHRMSLSKLIAIHLTTLIILAPIVTPHGNVLIMYPRRTT
jgi:hypothetical protein